MISMRKMFLIGAFMAVSAFTVWYHAAAQAPIPSSLPTINLSCSSGNLAACTDWTPLQWQTFMNFFTTKLDTTNGHATNLTVAKDLPNTGATQADMSVTTTAVGSGTNGPATAQNALSISLIKDQFPFSSAAVGEIDPLQIFGRQSGAGSDMSGVLINVQNTGTGFLSATEFASSIYNTGSNSITQQMDVQEGVLNAASGDYDGAVYTAQTGSLKYGVLVQSANGSTGWQYAFAALDPSNSLNFTVDTAGNVHAASYKAGASAGVSCSGTPTSSFASVNGIVTHC